MSKNDMVKQMTDLTANGSGAGRRSLLKKLVHSIGMQKQKPKSTRKDDAYADYWQVRNHRSPAPTSPVRK